VNLDGGVDPRGYHLTEATTFDTKGATNSTAFHGAGVVVGVDKWQTPLIRFFFRDLCELEECGRIVLLGSTFGN